MWAQNPFLPSIGRVNWSQCLSLSLIKGEAVTPDEYGFKIYMSQARWHMPVVLAALGD